jgi:hypothetical protein
MGRTPYRAQGRQLACRFATATARRGGLAAWRKRGSGWGLDIGPGRRLSERTAAGVGTDRSRRGRTKDGRCVLFTSRL